MESIQILRENRDKLMSQAKELSEREVTPETETKFDEFMSQVDELDTKIKGYSRKEELARRESSKNNAPNVIVRSGKKPTAERAFSGWARGRKFCTREEGESLDHYGLDIGADTLDTRALEVGSDSEGGYLVPATFVTAYEKKLSFISPVMSAMGQLPTSTGEAFVYPRVDDTSNSAAYVAEEGPIGDSTDPAFDQVSFPRAFDYFSPIVKISNQLLRDSILDIPSLLFGDLFPERHAKRMEALVFHASNDGAGEPEPVLHGVSAGVNLATSNPITIAKLFALESSMPIQYRANASLVMHDATWQAIRQLADDDLRPLINIDLQNGVEKRLLGYPVIICNTMVSYNAGGAATPGDNKPLILMADLSRYKVRRVGSPVVTRLIELYAATGQTGFCLAQSWDARWVGHVSVCATTLNSYDIP